MDSKEKLEILDLIKEKNVVIPAVLENDFYFEYNGFVDYRLNYRKKLHLTKAEFKRLKEWLEDDK